MYVAKCINKDYMERKLGTSRKTWEKVVIGGALTSFVLLLIVGPILLFSSVNPISTADTVTGGAVSVVFGISNTKLNTNQTVGIFTTESVSQIKMITD